MFGSTAGSTEEVNIRGKGLLGDISYTSKVRSIGVAGPPIRGQGPCHSTSTHSWWGFVSWRPA